MKNKNETSPPVSGDLLYLLCWQDTLERLDTLILELRHYQVSLIHALREPILYLPLRLEEAFLWGQDWVKEYPRSGGSRIQRCLDERPESLVRRWLCRYPDPHAKAKDSGTGTGGSNIKRERQVDEVERILAEQIKNAWRGFLGERQRRYYQLLQASQVFKQQILCDKVILCREALAAGLHRPVEAGEAQQYRHDRARFLVLRQVVHRKISAHIERLRDFQRAFGIDQDLGIQDHPRPSVGRRRELGIYSEFLSGRTRDLNRDIRLLLRRFRPAQYTHTEEVFHRWRHDATSRFFSFEDRVGFSDLDRRRETGSLGSTADPLLSGSDSNSDCRREVGRSDALSTYRFVNTSYFMPERPDLQSAIAHEVAHGVIRDHYENLSDWALGCIDDKDFFGQLLIELRRQDEAFRAKYMVAGELELIPPDFLRELACDFLAAAVKGLAYVYALFLDLIGFGLDFMGRRDGVERSDLDLEMALRPEAAPLGILYRRQWYLRLRLVVAWMQAIHHWDVEEGSLEADLLGGVEQICADLNQYLNFLLPRSRHQDGSLWEILGDQLCWVVEDSQAAKEVKAWRRERSQDRIKEGESPGPQHFPRSMARFPKWTRDCLYQVQLQMKCQPHRPLSGDFANSEVDLDKRFCEFYGVQMELDGASGQRKDKSSGSLYRHLYDIPWQSALMRARDLLRWEVKEKKCQQASAWDGRILEILHFDFPLGRELFHLGLEFYENYVESPLERFRVVTLLLEREVFRKDKDAPLRKGEYSDLLKRLEVWLESRKSRSSWALEKWIKKGNINEIQMSWRESVALEHLKEIETNDPKDSGYDPALENRLGRLCGYKLKQLYDILEEFQGQGPGLPAVLCSLHAYLGLRGSDEPGQGWKKKHEILWDALAVEQEPTVSGANTRLPFRQLSVQLLARISMAGSYSRLRPCVVQGGAVGAFAIHQSA